MNSASTLTSVTLRLWGKTDQQYRPPDLNTVSWQPLLAHLLDVAAVTFELLGWEGPERAAGFARALGLPGGTLTPGWRRLIALLTALHDLGKATPPFQALHPVGLQTALPFPPESLQLHSAHGLMSEQLLCRLFGTLKIDLPLAELLAEAVGMHHGERATGNKDTLASHVHLGHHPKGASTPWSDAQRQLFHLTMTACGLSYPELVNLLNNLPQNTARSGSLMILLAGLTSAADWVGSSLPGGLSPSPNLQALEDPQAYLTDARLRARQQLRTLGWFPWGHVPGSDPAETLNQERQTIVPGVPFPAVTRPLPAGTPEAQMQAAFAYLTPGRPFELRELQKGVIAMVSSLPADDSALLLIEGPMGIGKTEAALMVWLLRQDRLRGLYLGEPSMASGNAMYTRIAEFLDAQGLRGQVSFGLTHGASILSPEYRDALARSERATAAALPPERRDGHLASTWMYTGGRGILAPFAVGTADQLLLGVLGVKHHFVRLWGVSDRLVILDEVHAYDTYTAGLLDRLIGWLAALGTTVVVMSATLPAAARERLLNAWEDGHGRAPISPTAGPLPYPRMEMITGGGQRTPWTSTLPPARPLRVGIQPAPPGLQDLRDLAISLVEDGGCAGIICNTVERAQKLYALIEEELLARGETPQTLMGRTENFEPQPYDDRGAVYLHLLHGQYPGDERAAREKDLLARLGKPGGNAPVRPRRMILIATQVAEQSLDIDFDVMISDLSPVDLLLQRLGRMWRHDRPPAERHGHRGPVLHVAGLDQWPSAAVLRATAWGYVYPPALLLRTWTLLRALPGGTVDIPADLDALVQQGYAGQFDDTALDAKQRQELQLAWTNLQRQIADDARTAEDFRLPTAQEYVAAPKSIDGDLSGETPGDDQTEEDERPVTRLGRPSARMVPVTRESGRWEVLGGPFSPSRPARLEELHRREIDQSIAVYARSLRVSRPELVQALFREPPTIPVGKRGGRGWASVPLLMDCVPLEFVNRRAEIISGPRTLYLHLDPVLGLRYSKTPM